MLRSAGYGMQCWVWHAVLGMVCSAGYAVWLGADISPAFPEILRISTLFQIGILCCSAINVCLCTQHNQ